MNRIRLLPCIALLILMVAAPVRAELVEYTFDINYIEVNYTGKTIKAMAVGGTVPAPTIEASVGDTLRVTFNNKMDVESSIHWHGVLLPNDQDGVPYLTTPPIKAGGSLTYEFPVIHSGTYWYHSHTGLQEQLGVYGGIVFHPQQKQHQKTNLEHVVVLSDWTDENPCAVLSNLKKDGDYYALKKGTVQSWNNVIRHGWAAVTNRIRSSWIRMGPMDISDVGYDAFLVNGRRTQTVSAAQGETVLVRLINSAASTYFNVEFAGGPMTIVAADGPSTEPLKVNRLRIAIAETYDLLLSIPDKGFYELRATSEDGTGHASVFIGSGEYVYAPDMPKPNLYLQGHSHHMAAEKHTGMMMPTGEKKSDSHKTHGMGTSGDHKTMPKKSPPPVKHMKDYSHLVSKQDTSLPLGAPQREIPLELTGTMDGYIWSFNDKTLSQSDKILIRRGENVRFILKNMTMMHHPIHLHGHFFRVLNGQGKRSPLKHTVNVPAMGSVAIEFEANADRDWFFHCHNLYHMMAGMARVISYEKSSLADKDTIKRISHETWYTAANFSALNGMTEGSLGIFNTENAFETEYEYGYSDNVWEIESYYRRSFGRFFSTYAGADFEREGAGEKTEKEAVAGIKYLLPMFIESDLGIHSGGEVWLEVHSGFDLTSRADFEWEWETNFDGDYKYEFELSWELNKKLRVVGLYDSDHGWNAGLRVIL